MSPKFHEKVPEYRRVTLELQDDGTYVATWPLQKIRFLMSDGRTIDVVTSRDDSDLRGVLLEVTKAERIEGTARLPYPETDADGATPVPTRRRRVHRGAGDSAAGDDDGKREDGDGDRRRASAAKRAPG